MNEFRLDVSDEFHLTEVRDSDRDAFARYLPAEPSHRNNIDISTKSEGDEPSHGSSCYDSQKPKKAPSGDVVTGVTASDSDPDRSVPSDRTSAQRERFKL